MAAGEVSNSPGSMPAMAQNKAAVNRDLAAGLAATTAVAGAQVQAGGGRPEAPAPREAQRGRMCPRTNIVR